jgi:two-component system cell cycle response regulator
MTDESAPQEVSVLVVDDDEAVRETLSEFLKLSGYRVQSAEDGQSALTILDQQMVSVVITDIMMPGIDGLELTRSMKSRFDVDIMVMTGFRGNYSYEDAIESGASDFVFKPVRFEELLVRLKRMLKERALRAENQKMVSKLQSLAITDELTQLFNARHFHRELGIEIGRAQRYRRPLSLILLDIDHFKWFNDNFGHLEGDRVLAQTGRIIKKCLRSMDSAYRYGGEEFTVVLPETTCPDADHVAQRIRRAVEEQEFEPNPGKAVHLTISAGLTQYEPGETAERFIQRADKAMYVSKEGGRNLVTALSCPAPT